MRKMVFQQKNLWIIHVLGWLLFIVLPLTIMSRESDPHILLTVLKSGWFWLFFLIYFFAFYSNILFLIPQLFLKQRYVLYTAIFMTGFMLIFFFQPFENLIFKKFHERQFREMERDYPDTLRRPPPPERTYEPEMERRPEPRGADAPTIDFISMILFVVVWVGALATKISEQWRLSERKVILSEANKAQAELSFFKAQINPHFLFNTLNNIYALAVNNSEHTAASVLKLSQMMRYITEEATEDFVPLNDEIECLKNYIDLQRLRLNDKTKVEFEINGTFEELKIAPLILMTFVENAFKYGVSGHYENMISIRLSATVNRILFSCKNDIFKESDENERKSIGISNTRRRLEFQYPNTHELEIVNDGKMFEVRLLLNDA
jgi:two-component system LytT family sensor kinase